MTLERTGGWNKNLTLAKTKGHWAPAATHNAYQ